MTETSPPGTATGPPRVITIALPAGLPLLSLNDRKHWAARNRVAQALKTASWAAALAAKVPALDRVTITVEYQPPDRRRRDPGNLAATGKPLIDGLVAGGMLPDDDSGHVASERYEIGPLYPRGRLVLHVREILPEGAS
jgi:crossover junction endodeoxyribonuclease RusA